MTDFNNGIPEIDTAGFQVVKGDMFVSYAKYNEPYCTLWPTSIAFNKASINALNGCEKVRIEINPNNKRMLIVPVTSKDPDGVRWIKGIKDPASRKIECKTFATQLYKSWHLKMETNYRTVGKLVSSEQKIMILFDFNEADSWKSKANA